MSLSVYLECPYCKSELYTSNITHNLNIMAEEAGIYKALWRPEEVGISEARQLIEPLKEGIRKLEFDPAKFRKLNSPNKWGLYKHFLPFVKNYWKACVRYPNAKIKAWR